MKEATVNILIEADATPREWAAVVESAASIREWRAYRELPTETRKVVPKPALTCESILCDIGTPASRFAVLASAATIEARDV